jgi:hypothetical protein
VRREPVYILRRDVGTFLLAVMMPVNVLFVWLDMHLFLRACGHLLLMVVLGMLLFLIPKGREIHGGPANYKGRDIPWNDFITTPLVIRTPLPIKFLIAALIDFGTRYLMLREQTVGILKVLARGWLE